MLASSSSVVAQPCSDGRQEVLVYSAVCLENTALLFYCQEIGISVKGTRVSLRIYRYLCFQSFYTAVFVTVVFSLNFFLSPLLASQHPSVIFVRATQSSSCMFFDSLSEPSCSGFLSSWQPWSTSALFQVLFPEHECLLLMCRPRDDLTIARSHSFSLQERTS